MKKALEDWEAQSELFLPQKNSQYGTTLVKYQGKWRVVDDLGVSLRQYDMCTPFFMMGGHTRPRAIVKCRGKFNAISEDETLILEDGWCDYLSVFDFRMVSIGLWKYAGAVFRALRNGRVRYYGDDGYPKDIARTIKDAYSFGRIDEGTYNAIKDYTDIADYAPAIEPTMFIGGRFVELCKSRRINPT